MARSYGRGFLSVLAFVAFFLVGIALLTYMIVNGVGGSTSVADAIYMVAFILACIVVGFISFLFAYIRVRREWWWMVMWVAAATIIILAFILGNTGVL